MKTTLNKIREYSPCESSWKKLLAALGKTKADDDPLDFRTIRTILGIQDAIWCLRTQDYRDYCLFLVDVTESVLPIFESYSSDPAPRNAIKAIEQWRMGEITIEELKSAAADAADAAAVAAAYAADAAVDDDAAAAVAAADAADAATVAAYAAVAATVDDDAAAVAAYAYAAAAVAYAYAAYAAYATAATAYDEIEPLFIQHFEGAK